VQEARELNRLGKERLEEKRSRREKELEEKRRRIAQIRSETHPDVGAASKAFFYEQRKMIADDVRSSVCTWRHDREQGELEVMEKAILNRAIVHLTRAKAADGKAALNQQRANDANAKRLQQRSQQWQRMVAHERKELQQRNRRDGLTAEKFVDPHLAERVTASAYETLGTAHRTSGASLGSQGSTLLAGLLAGSGKVIGREPWKPSHHVNGWFASWWGGGGAPIESQQSARV
jgi:hypothetical protein